MHDLPILLTFAIALMTIDMLNTLFVYRLSKRVAAIEGASHVANGTCAVCRTTCAANAAAISALTRIVAGHTEEIAQMRDMSNANQAEIMKAIGKIHGDVMAAIETRIMPRATLEAALRDLYNRTTARDPDAEPTIDADVP